MKKWFTSKTIIVNVLTLAVGVLAVFTGSEWVMNDPQVAATLLSVVAAVNIVLRLFTSTAIR
jgi:hypothetical protein